VKRQSMKNELTYHIRENTSLYLFIIVLFLMGVIFGSIVVNSLDFVQKHDLYSYLNRFFGQVTEGKFASSKDMFLQSYFHNVKYIGLMWILGISIIGLPLILILLFLKGVVVGFTVGFLVNQMGWNGFILSFVSILPQNVIIIPAFIIMSTIAMSFSLKMVRQQFNKRIHEPIFPLFTRYTFVIIGLSCLLLLASTFEAFVSPTLMKQIFTLVSK
jgi:stage II sporulation protein M